MNSHQRRVKRRRNTRLQEASRGDWKLWTKWAKTREGKRCMRHLTRAFTSMRNTARIPVMPINITFEIVDPGFAKAAP